MRSRRRIKLGASLAAASVIGSLLVLVPAARGEVTQEAGTPANPHPNNYYGPEPCPGSDWNCTIINADDDVEIKVTQKAATGGTNRFVCGGGVCGHPTSGGVKQMGKATDDEPTNEASCTNTKNDNQSEQFCVIDQNGGNNTITANFTASPTAVGQITVNQRSEQRFYTTQVGDNNTLTVNGTIEQTATLLNSLSPPDHTQHTMIRAVNTMTAGVSNVANYVINRTQTSNAIGPSPKQQQDVDPTDNAGFIDAGQFGRGEVRLDATSDGTNSLTLGGTDLKDQNSTAVSGDALQHQGFEGGGWDTTFNVHTGQAPEGGFDVSIGDPTTLDPRDGGGLQKIWSQHAEVVAGGTRDQFQKDPDRIRIPIIGSGKRIRTNQYCNLTTDVGNSIANAVAEGFAGTGWDGRLACDLTDEDATTSPPTVTWFGQQGSQHHSLFCQINTDDCPGGGSSHAHMAVRNVNTDADFAETHPVEPTSTTAQAGETAEYALTFHNRGPGTVRGATLSAPIREGTPVASCSDSCDPSGGRVSWNLPDVGPDTSVVRTFRVSVDAPPGTVITNTASSNRAPDSNSTNITVVAPSSHTHLSVRNVDTGELFQGDPYPTGPGQTTARRDQTVEYAATFHNAGTGTARSAALSVPIPDGLTCVSGCSGSTASFPFGDVPPGESRTSTFQAKVNPDALAGDRTTTAAGSDEQEGQLANVGSATVTVDVPVAQPGPLTIDVLESSINASNPKRGTATVLVKDASVRPETACFGRADADPPVCVFGTSLGLGDFDGDGQSEWKIKFAIKGSGLKAGDQDACVRAETPNGTVLGCDSVKVI